MRSKLRSLALGFLVVGSFACGSDTGGGDDVDGSTGGVDAADYDGGGTAPDAAPPDAAWGTECVAASDCDSTYGAPPCGSWECNTGYCDVVCAGCTDADLDGYGAEGPGTCAGYDCDDADDTVGDSAATSCYSGNPAELAVAMGTCRAGTRTCVGGAWGQCVGEITPTAEACNNLDDDCDDAVDEDLTVTCGFGVCADTDDVCVSGTTVACTPELGLAAADDSLCNGVDDDCDGVVDEDCGTVCVTVSAAAGNDTQAIGDDNTTPFATIQAAIDWAAADATRPQLVCVAANGGCAQASYDETLTMADGVSVIGNWHPAFSTRCAFTWNNSGATAVFTRIRGASFADLTQPTALDGFEIARTAVNPAIGVQVDNSVGVSLANLDIPRAPAVETTIAVDIANNSDVVVTSSSIHGGNGTLLAIGVRAVDSRLELIDNCESFDGQGRCDAFCGQAKLRSIRGRHDTGARPDSYAVYLDNAPDSRIAGNAICGNHSDTGAAVYVTGDADPLAISENLINAWGGETVSHGIWLEDCGDAAPWVVDNWRIATAGENDTSVANAVLAAGSCHPVIEDNVLITGGGEGNAAEALAVHCDDNALGVSSRCVVLDNPQIRGSSGGVPTSAGGVRCDDGSCVRVAGNVIEAGAGIDTYGVILDRSGAVVEANYVDASCGVAESVGLLSLDSWARVENNQITGGYCSVGDPGTPFAGIHAITSDSGNEIDVHSNVIDAGPDPAVVCTGSGVLLEADTTSPPAGPVGSFRNNVLLGSDCNTAYLFREADAQADPRILVANAFDDRNGGVLYRDEASTDVTTAAAINGLSDISMVGSNKNAQCRFVSYPSDIHLDGADTECVDAGTSIGAPAIDFEGDARSDGTPDIGADER